MINSATKFRIRHQKWKPTSEAMARELHNQLEIASRKAVREMYASISVWTGRSAGSLLPAAQALGIQLNIQVPKTVDYTTKEGKKRVYKIVDQIQKGLSEGSFFISDPKPGQKSYTVRVKSAVPYFGQNDNFAVSGPPPASTKPAASHHWNPTPWNSQDKGMTLLAQEMHERVPKIASTLLVRGMHIVLEYS